jgi:hypothetical protein
MQCNNQLQRLIESLVLSTLTTFIKSQLQVAATITLNEIYMRSHSDTSTTAEL